LTQLADDFECTELRMNLTSSLKSWFETKNQFKTEVKPKHKMMLNFIFKPSFNSGLRLKPKFETGVRFQTKQ